MDLSGLQAAMGLGGEFSNPVGAAIEKATSESLVGADWSANIQICDEINRRQDGSIFATRAMKRRLKSENPKIVRLTLTLCDAVVKNCRRPLHQAVGSRDFLTEITALADGRKGWEVREQALVLLQDWGMTFQHDQGLYFNEAYNRLRGQGVKFPQVDNSAPVFTPPASISKTVSREPTVPPSQDQLEKLEADIESVKEKVMLCGQMLQGPRGMDNDEALEDLVGFLEACRPRMVDLVEAGMAGGLGEGLFEKCLKINDALLRTLEAQQSGTNLSLKELERDGDGDSDTAALIDFGGDEEGGKGGMEEPPVAKMSAFSIGGGGEDDDDDALLRRSSPSGARGGMGKLGAVPLKESASSIKGGSVAPGASSTTAAASSKSNDSDLEAFLDSLTEGSVANPPAVGGSGPKVNLLQDDELDKAFG